MTVVLRDMVGAYPLPLDQVSPSWNLTHALEVAMLHLKAEALFEFAPLRDILGDERLVLALDQSGLSLSHPKFYKDNQRVAQLREVVSVAAVVVVVVIVVAIVVVAFNLGNRPDRIE